MSKLNTSLTLQDFQYYVALSNEIEEGREKFFNERILENLLERNYTEEQIDEIRYYFRGETTE